MGFLSIDPRPTRKDYNFDPLIKSQLIEKSEAAINRSLALIHYATT
jgi:hypothetical protein